MAENNLFLNWLNAELEEKSLAETLRDINSVCGTSYKSNWPSKMEAAEYKLERLPKSVRQYMMKKVLPILIKKGLTEKEIERLVNGLT